MGKKICEEEIGEEEEVEDSLPESDNNRSRFLRKKPWTEQ
jgi:hypothetical protein